MSTERELGSFETALVLTGQRAPFVVTVVMQLHAGPPVQALASALARLQRLQPLLAVRIATVSGRMRFEGGAAPAVPLTVRRRAGEDGWQAAVEDELNQGMDIERGPLLRCSYLAPAVPGEPAEILLSFHHAVMDAVSGATLLRELLALCDGGREAALARPGAPLPAAVESLLPARFRGVQGGLRRLRFLAVQLADEALYRWRTRGRRPRPARPARCRILPLRLESASVAALVQATRRRRVTLNAALSAALLLAVCRRLRGGRGGPLRHIGFADLRPQLYPALPEGSLASCISMLRLTVDVHPRRGFWPLAARLTRQAQAVARRGDKFTALRLAAPLMRSLVGQDRERMATTALSYMGALREAALGPGLRGLHAFVSNLDIGPEYTAQARLFRGELQLDVVYLDGDMDQELAQAVGEELLGALREASRAGGTP